MSTATAPAPAAERTPRDVLAEDVYYSRLNLHKDLGISMPIDPVEELANIRGGSGPHQTFLGREVLAWIENNEIECTLRDDDERLFPEDILQADQFYTPEQLKTLLDIQVLTNSLVDRHRDIFTRRLGEGVHLKVLGAEVCRWITEKHIQWSITDTARLVYHRHEYVGKHATPPQKNVAERAVDLMREQREQNEQSEREWQANALSRYLQLLSHGENLPDATVAEFADLMRDLDISPEAVANDRTICEKAIDLAEKRDARQDANKALLPVRQARDVMRKRHERESMEAEDAIRGAEGHAAECNNAAHKLTMLKRQRPELFTTDKSPPRLLAVAPPPTTDSEQPADNDISD